MRSSPRGWLLAAMAAAVCVLGGASWGGGASPAEKRLALVVGNAAYRSDDLPTAADDAGLVAEALAQDGFAVTAVADADAATLRKAVAAFADKVRSAGGKALVFVYMSGHGVQYAGADYVVPVDASIDKQSEIPAKAVPLSEILNLIEGVPARARVFVYDLAHRNSIAKGVAIPLAGGLRHMQPGPRSVYAFNAAPGMVGRSDVPFYGIYARALAEALRTPGLGLHALFSRVRLRVAEITGGAVVPWDNGETESDVTLLSAAGGSGPGQIANRPMTGLPVETVYWASIAEDTLAGYQAFLRAFPNDPLSVRIKVLKAVRLEAATWAESCRANTASAYWTFMSRYPRGPHYVDVRRRLAAIHAALDSPMRFDASDLGGLPTPSAEDVRMADQTGLTFADPAWPPPPPVPAELLPSPPAAIYQELAPPPLVPAGALPIPAPLPGSAPRVAIGPIEQPFVTGVGRLTITAEPTAGDGIAITSSSDDGLITQTTTRLDSGRRTIVQTDAANEVVSWTTVVGKDRDLTITQTGGGSGDLLSRQVTRTSPEGESATILTNGYGQLVAEMKVDKAGTISAVTVGTARIADQSLSLTAPETPPVDRAPAPPIKAPPPGRIAPKAGAAPEPGSTKGPAAPLVEAYGPAPETSPPESEAAPESEPTRKSEPARKSESAPVRSPASGSTPGSQSQAPARSGPPPTDLGLQGVTAEPAGPRTAPHEAPTAPRAAAPMPRSIDAPVPADRTPLAVPLTRTPATPPTPATSPTSAVGPKVEHASRPLPVPRPAGSPRKKRPLVFLRRHHPRRR